MKNIFKLPTLALTCLLSACGGSKDNQATEPAAAHAETAESMRTKQWQLIGPKEIEGNAVKLFGDEWFALAAGKENDMNMMTIAWGTLGVVWGKPVVTVYVSTSRYTYEFMERNEYFTITHFPPAMRQSLQYIGTVSGRDGDKLKDSGLTAEYTALGNPIFSESDLAIECRKIYAEPFKPELMPLEQREWYDQKGIGVHVAYIGEIVNVWKK
ncbi:MAG: flavin reductase [Bacteroidales bacterium]|nr:flavin reductase [Bacteroidales bacterium]